MGTEEFKDIWLPLSGRFYRVAFYILESEDDAEDAVQDLFSKLWKLRNSLDHVNNPLAFGLTAIRNICLDKVRKKSSEQSRRSESGILESQPDPSADLGRSLVGKENLEKIRSCMARLPDSQREILEMRVFEELSFKEIAHRMGMSEVNVRVKLSTARKNLKKMIGHEEY